MCIDIVKSSNKPYTDDRIRYKVVRVRKFPYGLFSCYVDNKWHVGKNNTAKHSSERPHDTSINAGFHCLLTMADAEKGIRGDNNSDRVIIKLEVKGFIAAGTWDSSSGNFKNQPGEEYLKTETWKQAKVLKVICRGGRDITKRFISTK